MLQGYQTEAGFRPYLAARTKKKRRLSTSPAAPPLDPSPGASSAERVLKALGAEMGVGRAIEVVGGDWGVRSRGDDRREPPGVVSSNYGLLEQRKPMGLRRTAGVP
jgi:hypothetical protein